MAPEGGHVRQSLLIATLVLVAFPVGEPGAQTFTSGIELVTLSVVVTNRAGSEHVRELTAADFRVFENGREHPIVAFGVERRPQSVCVLLDSSESMQGARQRLAAAIVDRLISGLEAEDEAALVVFAGDVEVPVPWTPAREFPTIDWAGWRTEPHTALLDGLSRAMTLADTARHPRTVFVIVSDGGENASRHRLSDLVKSRRQSEVRIYAFDLADIGAPIRAPEAARTEPADFTTRHMPLITGTAEGEPVLRPLVGDSGGDVYRVKLASPVEATVNGLLDELRHQYHIAYEPAVAPDGAYRKLKVEVRDRRLRVRHRSGYLAMPVPR